MNFQIINNTNNTEEGFCLIKSVEVKKMQKGGEYLDLILADKSGEISAKKWDYSQLKDGVFEADTIVKVRGVTTEYKGTPQFRIDRMRTANESDGIDINDFVPSADFEPEDMYNELYCIAQNFKDSELKTLVTNILEENKEKLLFWPAAYRLHHALKGGLLYHTLSIVRMAQRTSEIYPYVDSDLLLSGAILHDIAKLDEYDVAEQTGIAKGYTVEGNLIGHLVKGAMYIHEKSKQLNISEHTAMLIEHMLISHHGEPDFGCACRPMFIEAELLSMLDTLDAKMYEMAENISQVEQGEFTQRLWALDNRKLYNHGRTEVKPRASLFEED
ncbi:MAG: HD domain-containing protein [Clostridiales bacterium]|nr:HD domain-containing protein [Clostridiales bacterium]